MKGDVKLGYRFFFPAGKTIGHIRRTMRAIARKLGFTPEELYAPDALNLPELLTVPEMKRILDK